MDDIIWGNQSVSLLYNYFQAHYAPLKMVHFAEEYYLRDKNTTPFFGYYGDRAALPEYVNKSNIVVQDIKDFNPLLKHFRKAYIISAFPFRLEKELSSRYPDLTCRRLNEQLQYHNLLYVSEKKK